MNITPENITSLKPHEVFVFGSNTQGRHGKGAAALARKQFGAKQGQPVGLQGQSYAIITKDLTKPKDRQDKSVSLSHIKQQIDLFLKFAIQHKERIFYVTEIGCGLAGYTYDEIAPLFTQPLPPNVYLPKKFWDVLLK